MLTLACAQVNHLSEFAVPRAFPLVACAALALHGVSDTRETRRGRVSKLPPSHRVGVTDPVLIPSLFDRTFGLGIQPARNWSSLAMNGANSSTNPGSGSWAALRSGAGDTVSTQKANSARYFLYIEMRDDPIAATGTVAERGRENSRSLAV